MADELTKEFLTKLYKQITGKDVNIISKQMHPLEEGATRLFRGESKADSLTGVPGQMFTNNLEDAVRYMENLFGGTERGRVSAVDVPNEVAEKSVANARKGRKPVTKVTGGGATAFELTNEKLRSNNADKTLTEMYDALDAHPTTRSKGLRVEDLVNAASQYPESWTAKLGITDPDLIAKVNAYQSADASNISKMADFNNIKDPTAAASTTNWIAKGLAGKKQQIIPTIAAGAALGTMGADEADADTGSDKRVAADIRNIRAGKLNPREDAKLQRQRLGLDKQPPIKLPPATDSIRTLPQGNIGIPRDSQIGPRDGILEKVRDLIYNSEAGRRLMSGVDGLTEILGEPDMGNVGLAGAAGPISRVAKEETMLKRGANMVEKKLAGPPSALIKGAEDVSKLPSGKDLLTRGELPQAGGPPSAILPGASQPPAKLPTPLEMMPKQKPPALPGVDVSMREKAGIPKMPNGPKPDMNYNIHDIQAPPASPMDEPLDIASAELPWGKQNDVTLSKRTAAEERVLKQKMANVEANSKPLGKLPSVPESGSNLLGGMTPSEVRSLMRMGATEAGRKVVKYYMGYKGAQWLYDTLFGSLDKPEDNN